MGDFKQLEVWKIAKDLAVYIYTLTKQNDFNKDFGLRDQIRKAAISISSNISEGDESGTNKMCVRYLHIAKGSNAEIQTQTIIANEIGYISNKEKDYILLQCEIISKKLFNLIKYRSHTPNHKPQT
ncbi:MAG: four helix bundle protein [Candidatus Marinimicrobia bacterium]|nr:four helix bundle protein [Candidatus Neomarinimicrobiota bacterium]